MIVLKVILCLCFSIGVIGFLIGFCKAISYKIKGRNYFHISTFNYKNPMDYFGMLSWLLMIVAIVFTLKWVGVVGTIIGMFVCIAKVSYEYILEIRSEQAIRNDIIKGAFTTLLPSFILVYGLSLLTVF